jgi:AcrR family transcriptional regulator
MSAPEERPHAAQSRGAGLLEPGGQAPDRPPGRRGAQPSAGGAPGDGGPLPDGDALPDGGALADGSRLPDGDALPDGGPLPDGGAARRMRADARRNRQALVSAASAAFIEHGADDASLEEIARRAGVGIGTLYRHFPTRQALLEAVYRDQVEAMSAKAGELLDSAPPTEALVTWLRALVEFGSTKRSLTSAMLTTLDKDSELVSACSAMMRQSAAALLARAQEAGEVRSDADPTDVLRLVHGVSMIVQHRPGDAGQADRMIGLIIDGLRYQPDG